MPKTYEINILGTDYAYRGATRRELEVALNFDSQTAMEDYLVETCVVNPKIDLEECLAGVPVTLSEVILEASGITEEGSKKLQKIAEEWAVSIPGKLEMLMAATLHLSLDTINNLDPIDYHKSSIAAQILSNAMYNLNIDEFLKLDPFNKKGKKITQPRGKNFPPPLVQ